LSEIVAVVLFFKAVWVPFRPTPAEQTVEKACHQAADSAQSVRRRIFQQSRGTGCIGQPL